MILYTNSMGITPSFQAPHAGRVFFFATERDSETRRWVAAIRGVLAETAEKPQTLEEFLGDQPEKWGGWSLKNL